MRVRPVPLLVAIFGSAAAMTVFVVREIPREGERVSAGERAAPLAQAPDAPDRFSGDRSRVDARPAGPSAAIEGAILRPGGGPAAGAEVAVFAHGTRTLIARAASGRDGAFAVTGLAPGAYDVRAAAAGASSAWIPGVTLAPGDRFPLRVALEATGAVEGAVRDTDGRPLAGVRVRATTRSDGPAPPPPVEVHTDFEGHYRLDGVQAGRSEIVARQEQVALGVAGVAHVQPGRESRVDLVLPDAGELAGRVAGAAKALPAGTSVVAVAMGAGQGALQSARAVPDASGTFRLTVPAGEYRVHAVAGAAAHPELREAPTFVRVEAGRTSRIDLSLEAVREAGVEILVLEPGGAPAAGALVTVTRPDDGRVALATSAGEDGRVVIGARMGMAGNEVTIRARNGGRTGTKTLALPGAGTVAVRLSPAAAVAGVIRGASSAGFTVEVSSEPAAGSWRTLDVHRFAGSRFELADLPSEPLRLSIRADDGRRGTAEIRLAPGERRSIEIALR